MMGESSRLDIVLKQIDKKYGKGTVIRGSQYPSLERFSSGIFAIDAEIGGGIPRGRILIFTGNESTGKTTVAKKTIATAQRTCRNCGTELVESLDGVPRCPNCSDGGKAMTAFYCDIEGAFDPVWFEALGGNNDDLYLFQPEFAEQAVDVVEAIIRTGDVDVIVVDSIAMLSPAAEIEKSAEDQLMGTHAKLVNRMMRAIQAGFNSLGTNNAKKPTVILINQVREKVGVMYGSPDVMPGGRGQSFASSVTLKFFARPSEKLCESVGDKKQVGQQIRFNVEKNKTFPPHRSGVFTLYTDDSEEYGVKKGTVDNMLSIFRYALRYDVVSKVGSWYSYVQDCGNEIRVQGEDKFIAEMEARPDLVQELKTKAMERVLA
jgi:recombination protein RecA